MTKVNYKIQSINPTDLSGFRELPNEDLTLVTSADIVSSFIPNQNAVEVSFYTLDDVRLSTLENYTRYSILSGDRNNNQPGNSEISIDVLEDYKAYGFEGEEIKVVYNFLDYLYTNTLSKQLFYIDTISSDRTEVRLVSLNLTPDEVLETTNELQERINNDTYKSDFNISFGSNLFYSIVNIKSQEYKETNAVIIKLLQPLPIQVNNKSTLSLVEKVANSVAYEVNFTVEEEKISGPVLRGANFTVEVEEQSTEPSSYYDYNELFSFPVNNSNRQLNSLFNEKGAELGIDYTKYSNFINFSSIEERLRNFKYKLDLLEVHQNNLNQVGSNSNLAVNYSGTGVSGSVEYYTSLVTGIVNNFDHYERHLFYNSGSSSWPKVGNSKPYTNKSSATVEATSWYSAETTKAIDYDAQNPDILINTIASFLKEDTTNDPYLMFVHMIGQHFDNLWTYTDAVSKKYDTDNRLDVGVSKDLVEQLLKNFGVKLYTSNKSVEDLFKYFTVNSYEPGEEKLDLNNPIQSGKDPLSQNDYQKEIYKRIYHNLPLLMKSKGTERGLRALINCFGIPSDVLKLKVFGGQSAQNTPFYGGEQAWTGSLDKVRVDNTGSIVAGDTLSFYTPITRLDDKYTQDLHRIEIGFSPSDNVNAYIVSQSAYLFPNENFNIDQYIGDPRGYETNKYLDLYNYAKLVFNNVSAYNVKDFVRLIKFFDNVIFRMVKDFTPARSVTDSGIIIKPHLLERYKAEAPVMTWTQPIFSGSISTAFITGSNAGAFSSNADNTVGTLYNITQLADQGVPSSRFDREYNTNYLLSLANPLTGSRGISNPGNLTPGSRSLPFRRLSNFDLNNPGAKAQISKNFGEAKFDGEFAGSRMRISNGELNPDNPWKNLDYPIIKYNAQFWSNIPDSVCILTTGSSSPFVTGSNVSINIPASSIFSGATSTAYTFTADGELLQNNILTIPEDAEQYQEYLVEASHINNPIVNSQTGESFCTITNTVKVVYCGLNSIAGYPPGVITLQQPYNFYAWFFPTQAFNQLGEIPLPLNTDLEFFVNSESIGILDANGETSSQDIVVGNDQSPTNYSFNNAPEDLTEITVSVKDQYDSSCSLEITLPFTLCAIADIYQNLSQTQIDLSNYSLSIGTSFNNFFFSYPFNFTGTVASTLFYFRIMIRRKESNNIGQVLDPGYQTQWGYSEWIQINADPGVSTVSGDSNIPNAWTATDGNPSILNIYQAQLEADELLGPYFVLQLDGDPGGLNYTGNFYRNIQFKAVNSDNCFSIGQEYLLLRSAKERQAVTFTYHEGHAGPTDSFSMTTCMLNPNNSGHTKTVYVDVSTDASTPTTPGNVIHQFIPIFEYEDTNEPAAPGTYAYDIADADNPSGWWFGRQGRRWMYSVATGAGPAWDNTAGTGDDNSFDGAAGNSAGIWQWNSGKIYCGEPNFTGDDDGSDTNADNVIEDADATDVIG